jgi:hypothetical protein
MAVFGLTVLLAYILVGCLPSAAYATARIGKTATLVFMLKFV